MEFPEKLYIQNRMHPYSYLTACKDIMRDDDIEYTRTDAIIEKACKWFNNSSISDYLSGEMIEDFKRFIKSDE